MIPDPLTAAAIHEAGHGMGGSAFNGLSDRRDQDCIGLAAR